MSTNNLFIMQLFDEAKKEFDNLKDVDFLIFEDSASIWGNDSSGNTIKYSIRYTNTHNGYMYQEKWAQNDVIHKDNLPAMKTYNSAKELLLEVWFFYSRMHRTGGPAKLNYLYNKKEWYWLGIKMKPEEIFKKLSKEQQLKAAFDLDVWK